MYSHKSRYDCSSDIYIAAANFCRKTIFIQKLIFIAILMPPNQMGIVTKRLEGKYCIHQPACPKPKMLAFSLIYSTSEPNDSMIL